MKIRINNIHQTKIIVTNSVVLLILVLIVSCDSRRQPDITATSDNIFATIEYDKVIAYDYNGEGDIEIVDKHGKLAKKIKKQIELNEFQIIRLTNDLCDESSYGEDIAMCFDPHFGIVFYKADKPVGFVSICLECNYLLSSINIPYATGFSDKGRNRIVDFEKELDFWTPRSFDVPVEEGVNEENTDNVIYAEVDQQAAFPGGFEAMAKFLSKNLNYPEVPRRMSIQGTVFVSFIVDKEGNLSDVQLVKGIHADCDKEAIRVVHLMPPWKAGKQDGLDVKSRLVLPIKFKLEE